MNVAFVVPNLCNDMHDCSAAQGDAFLRAFLPGVLTAPEWAHTLLVVSFDEGAHERERRRPRLHDGRPPGAGRRHVLDVRTTTTGCSERSRTSSGFPAWVRPVARRRSTSSCRELRGGRQCRLTRSESSATSPAGACSTSRPGQAALSGSCSTAFGITRRSSGSTRTASGRRPSRPRSARRPTSGSSRWTPTTSASRIAPSTRSASPTRSTTSRIRTPCSRRCCALFVEVASSSSTRCTGTGSPRPR